ncbi:MAG: hypothetical protein HC836_39585 [Richelia sp. RM2_1_2]|nr:hypothetical protein [Richelia sp. RM1_1_1]NJO64068.1 hypothetical protein [Richelia sp. RM2_1_2]
MKAWNLTVASLVLVISLYIPKAQAKNVVETETNQAKSTFLASADSQLIIKPTLTALNDTYSGPNEDFTIWMPGSIQENGLRELMSWSDITQTAYMIVHTDLSVKVPYLSAAQINEILQTSMRGHISSTGKIVRSTNLEIGEYPGLELLVQHSDGKKGQYQGFIVKGRMYVLGAVTEGELTTEAVNFFDSFSVNPEVVR